MAGSESTNSEPSDRTKRQVWAAAAGRCTFCNALLTENENLGVTVPIGELAHNVGRRTLHREVILTSLKKSVALPTTCCSFVGTVTSQPMPVDTSTSSQSRDFGISSESMRSASAS